MVSDGVRAKALLIDHLSSHRHEERYDAPCGLAFKLGNSSPPMRVLSVTTVFMDRKRSVSLPFFSGADTSQ